MERIKVRRVSERSKWLLLRTVEGPAKDFLLLKKDLLLEDELVLSLSPVSSPVFWGELKNGTLSNFTLEENEMTNSSGYVPGYEAMISSLNRRFPKTPIQYAPIRRSPAAIGVITLGTESERRVFVRIPRTKEGSFKLASLSSDGKTSRTRDLPALSTTKEVVDSVEKFFEGYDESES